MMIMPAALKHQKLLADAVASAKAAGVDCADQQAALCEFIELVYRFNAVLTSLGEADNFREDDPLKRAEYMKQKVFPLMEKLRELGDQLEIDIAAEYWPLPSYRELLFIK